MKNKYNIGDIVWYISSNRIYNNKITGILELKCNATFLMEYKYMTHLHSTKEKICISIDNMHEENTLFQSKEELIASL